MRRFDRLLIHRCTMIYPGQVTGQDAYGRDIVDDLEYYNVRCRADRIRESQSRDETGTDYLLDYMLFFGSELEVMSLDAKIQDVFDEDGNLVLAGTFQVETFNPIYRKKLLHHYEVTLKRA